MPQNVSEDTDGLQSGAVNFEEYKMYLDTAERVTDRRLELNKTNASLSLLILTGIGAISSWAFGKAEVQPFAVVIVGMISLLAAIFTRWWFKQIVSYKDLNNAKFTVLEEMAPKVCFEADGAKLCVSYEPFRREWQVYQSILDEKRGLSRFSPGRALSASLSEVTVPAVFFASFLMIFAISVTMSARGRYDLLLLDLLKAT